jgi:hypothetical protein
MKAEKILSFIENAISRADEESKKLFDFCITKLLPETGRGLDTEIVSDKPETFALAVIYTEAKAEYNNELAKSAGKLDTKKAAERMITELRQGRLQAGKIKTPDGKYIYCTGCHGIRIADAFNVPDWQGATPEVIIECFNTCAQNNGERLTPPSMAELKNIIRQTKAENKVMGKYAKAPARYDFGEGLPMVDAQRLLDIMQALGEVTITAAANNPTDKGLYLNSNIGDAVLLPIRKTK